MWDTGAMNPDIDTEEELLAASYKVAARGNASMLEPKDKIKARLGRSPDRSDAIALAVAAHVGRVQQRGPLVIYGW